METQQRSQGGRRVETETGRRGTGDKLEPQEERGRHKDRKTETQRQEGQRYRGRWRLRRRRGRQMEAQRY